MTPEPTDFSGVDETTQSERDHTTYTQDIPA